MLLLSWLACTSEVPSRYLVLQPIDGEYTAAPMEIPSLEDPRRLTGALGDGVHGGEVSVELLEGLRTTTTITGGRAINIGFAVDSGLGVATDPTGMALWSFYAHLDAMRMEMGALGYDVEPIFPVEAIVFEPTLVAFPFAFSNAAYSADADVFVLLPDAYDGVPFAANVGIVRHEFSHAWFNELTGGSRDSYLDEWSLNEGFADAVAGLTLDDPIPYAATMDNESRDLTGDWTAPDAEGSSSPYTMGTVYASLVWDLRETTDDREDTLAHLIDSLLAWHLGTNAEEGAAAEFPRFFVESYQADPDTFAQACIFAAFRFPSLEIPACTP